MTLRTRKQDGPRARRCVAQRAQASDEGSIAKADNVRPTIALSAIIGGAGLVTGSTVGAGILALPAVTHSTGFGPTTGLLLACWAVLQLEAILIVEVNLSCHEKLKKQQPDGTPIPPLLLADMTRMTLGSIPEAITSSVYLMMSFTLLLAYIAKAGDIFDSAVIQSTPLEAFILGPMLFTIPLATTFIRGGTQGLEKTNRNLTGAMLVLFAAVVGWGFTQVPWELSPLSHADTSDVADLFPYMFLSLVYHDLVPVVCHYLGFNRTRILAAIILGSVIPLGMLLAFEAVCLGLVPFTEGVSVDPVAQLISSQGPVAGTVVAVFSLAALATSAIGTTLSVTSFWTTKLETLTSINQMPFQLPQLPQLRDPSSSAALKSRNKKSSLPQTDSSADESASGPKPAHVCAVLLTLTPPTIASMSGTDIFMTATHLAGAYGDTALYGLLPPILAWAVRRNGDAVPADRGQLLPGGEPILAGLFAAGAVVLTLQLKEDVNFGGAASPASVSADVGQWSIGFASNLMMPVSGVSDGLMHGTVHLM